MTDLLPTHIMPEAVANLKQSHTPKRPNECPPCSAGPFHHGLEENRGGAWKTGSCLKSRRYYVLAGPPWCLRACLAKGPTCKCARFNVLAKAVVQFKAPPKLDWKWTGNESSIAEGRKEGEQVAR